MPRQTGDSLETVEVNRVALGVNEHSVRLRKPGKTVNEGSSDGKRW